MSPDEIRAHIDPMRPEFAEERSLVLPALKFAQTEKGYLTQEDLAAVADAVHLTPAYVESVASFYDRLYLRPVGTRVVSVCVTLSCMLRGSDELLEHICEREGLPHGGGTSDDGAVTVQEAQCLGYCDRAPCAQVDAEETRGPLTLDDADRLLDELRETPRPERLWEVGVPESYVIYRHREAGRPLTELGDYRRAGGYEALRKALHELDRDEAVYQFVRSGLRGRGGAGFPMGRKASFIPKDSALPAYVVCNADESEPGTFKDREIMEDNPFQLLEGVTIAGYAIGAARGYIYVRGEYEHQARILESAIAQARAAGVLGTGLMGSSFDFDITLYRGAGAYICGEETALLESLEGKRGQPRLKPPFPAVAGLYASPTLINNVETLAALPPIVERGADWYADVGTEKSTGTKVFSISGHVVRPGNYEIVMGDTTLRELVYDIAGGFRPGRDFAAAWVGGSSVNVVGAEALDTPLDYESLAAAGTSLGCAGCIVMDDSGSIVRSSLRLAHFYRHESCGKCTPCREGMIWLERILQRIVDGEGRMEDLELIESLGARINGRVLCALADTGILPVLSAVRRFRDDFVRAIENGGDPRPDPMMEAAVGG